MTTDLREFYMKHGDDYDIFLKRLMNKETLIQKYLGLFLKDTTFLDLKESMQGNNYELILNLAHTLKGVALNINLTKLGQYASSIVDDIRECNYEYLKETFSKLQIEYDSIINDLT